MQHLGKGRQQVAFLSRRLCPSEVKYYPYDKEMCAMAYCLCKWRYYLEGSVAGVTMMTDRSPATTFMDQANLSRTQTRWLKQGYFESIMPTIKYIPGKANVVADAISRSLPPLVGTVVQPQVNTIVTSCLSDEERIEWIQALHDDAFAQTKLELLQDGKTVHAFTMDSVGLLYFQPIY